MKDEMNEGTWTENVWAVGTAALIIGLIIGFLIGWFWQKNAAPIDTDIVGNEQNATNTSNGNTNASSSVPALANTYETIDAPAFVSVDDQKAGSLVFIKHVEVSKPSWIAVREVVDGAIGNILGAGMVTAATDDVPVTLLRTSKAGEKYAAFLYQDNGDGRFDFKTDLLVLQNDMPVATMFAAQ